MQTPIQQSQPYVSTAEGNQAVYQAFPAYQLSQCQMASSSRTPESSMPMYSPSPSQFVNQQRIPPMPPYSHLPSQDGFNGSTSFTELGHQFETMSLEANKRLAIQGSHYSQPTYTVNKNFPHNDLDYLTPQVAPSDVGDSKQYSATGFTGQDTNLSQPNYPPRQVYPTIPPFVQSIQNASNPSYPSPHLPAQPPGLPSANRRLNADHMPSAIEFFEKDRALRTGNNSLFITMPRGLLPPLVTSTDVVFRDAGNCCPSFIRSSLYCVPTNSNLLKSVGIPFSLSICPFAQPGPQEQPILLSDMGHSGPVRCIRCKSYINPFMLFIDGGRRFQCALCHATTEVPPEYFAHLDHNGQRVDAMQRPELCLGSYELTATAEYCKNNEIPEAPAFIFVIEASKALIKSGLVSLFCNSFIDSILPNFPRQDQSSESVIHVGFITYDSTLHFYSMPKLSRANKAISYSSSLPALPALNGDKGEIDSPDNAYARPKMHIVADMEEAFVPGVEGFILKPQRNLLQSLLQFISANFGHFHGSDGHSRIDDVSVSTGGSDSGSMLGPAIQAGLEALKAANRPGKLFVLHGNLPSAVVPGRLVNREDRKLIGTDKEKVLLNPVGDFYTNLAQTCVDAGCSVDIFLFPSSYVDLATIAEVPKITGGHIFKYTCFQADLHGEQFLSDLSRAVARPRAFDAVLRVRTSTGTRPVDFLGRHLMRNTTDVELACIDDESCPVTVEIKHDDKLSEGDIVYIQVACLYTSVEGKRRLRIHNLSLNTSSQHVDIYRLCDLDSHVNWLAKFTCRAALSKPHSAISEELTTRLAQSLFAYRRYCTGPGIGAGSGGAGNFASPAELVLPETLKLLPLFVQSLIKCDAIKPALDITLDDKSLAIFLILGMDSFETNILLYPRLYSIHNLPDGFETLPTPLRCSFERVSADSAYIVDNGISGLILWLGNQLPSDWLLAAFGVARLDQIEENKNCLPEMPTPVSQGLHHLIRLIRANHRRYCRLMVIRQSDKSEIWFKRFMYEDRIDQRSISYLEYLCHIHKEVRSLLK